MSPNGDIRTEEVIRTPNDVFSLCSHMPRVCSQLARFWDTCEHFLKFIKLLKISDEQKIDDKKVDATLQSIDNSLQTSIILIFL